MAPSAASNTAGSHSKWLEHETVQMRRIHAAYLGALDLEEMTAARSRSGAKRAMDEASDPEFFLPLQSTLRSERGEMARPAPASEANHALSSYDAFVRSIDPTAWLSMSLVVAGSYDDAFTDAAKKIVQDICVEQSREGLRDKGSTMLKFGATAEREHLTPLSICLHELKIWCMYTLATLKPRDRSAYVEIAMRCKFAISLVSRDVWISTRNMMRHGLSNAVYARLSLLLQRTVSELDVVKEHAFKLYFQAQGFDKMGHWVNLGRMAFFNAAKLASALCALDSTRVSQQYDANQQITYADLTESRMRAATGTCDFANAANLMIRAMCSRPFARVATAEDTASNPKPADDDKPPPNLFAARSSSDPEPTYVVDSAYRPLPAYYTAAHSRIYAELGVAPRYGVKYPIGPAKQLALWKRAFPDPVDLALALRTIGKLFAAIDDILAPLYAAHELWSLCGQYNVNVFESMRHQFMRVTAELITRVAVLEAAETFAVAKFAELASKRLADQGKMEEASQLLLHGPGVPRVASKNILPTAKFAPGRLSWTGLPQPEPVWIQNLDFIALEMLQNSGVAARDVYLYGQSIARDAYDFGMFGASIHQLSPDERRVSRIVDTYCDRVKRPEAEFHGGFNLTRLLPVWRFDWLNLGAEALAPAFANAASAAATLASSESECAAYRGKHEEMSAVLESYARGGDIKDVDADFHELTAEEDSSARPANGKSGHRPSDARSEDDRSSAYGGSHSAAASSVSGKTSRRIMGGHLFGNFLKKVTGSSSS